jgi:aminoglycoside-2''-adenylyltransferase
MPSELDVSSPWKPLSLAELVEQMRGASFFWCLAGGHAIAHVLGRSYRPHGDIDIVVLRPDQLDVQNWFREWRLYAANPRGSLRPWRSPDTLPVEVHDVWCHREGSRKWELQIMIQESDGKSWYFRRDARVHGSVDDLAPLVNAVPCLRTDLQLLFKSKEPRAKDNVDFRELLPVLTDEQRERLAYWLGLTAPGDHPWLTELAR